MNRLMLVLTPEQSAQIEPFMAPGVCWLGRIRREGYDANLGNAEAAGRLVLEAGCVRESVIPKLREVILASNAPPKARRRKAQTEQ